MNFVSVGKILFFSCFGAVAMAASVNAAPAVISANWNSNWKVSDSSAVYSGCSNSGGNQITLSGKIATIGAVRAHILASNNDIYTKSFTIVGKDTIDLAVASGQPKTFQKQGSADGVGGNPWIGWSYQSDGENVSWLGRCVQGSNGGSINGNGSLLNSITFTVATSLCSPSKSEFKHNGVNQSNGVGGTIYLYNSTNNPQQTGTTGGILTAGGKAEFLPGERSSRSSTRSMAGGNPRIYVKLETSTDFTLNSDGSIRDFGTASILRPVGAKEDGYLYVGRCKELLQ